jgi:hypothetical protein
MTQKEALVFSALCAQARQLATQMEGLLQPFCGHDMPASMCLNFDGTVRVECLVCRKVVVGRLRVGETIEQASARLLGEENGLV